jgi:hypothetical protein
MTIFLPSPYFFLKSSDAELMQYRRPVGFGPSSKTWPRWEPQFEQTTSVREIPWLWSVSSATFSFFAVWKLGQPVPDSNLVFESKRSTPQTIQVYVPSSWLFQYFPVKARSVPFCRVTSYCWSFNFERQVFSSTLMRGLNLEGSVSSALSELRTQLIVMNAVITNADRSNNLYIILFTT